ncbi:reverse transcriptase [Senna tora]|uniref:Reverse transcriptase n=1 Tax=Senna tora TaxID=362788 RepID=A0A834SHR4_9FABA|nr:reverse transcriptase [Senna tora]
MGGVIRNADGVWIVRFAGYIGHATCMQTELAFIRQGLVLVVNTGVIEVELETDSLEVVRAIIMIGKHESHSLGAYIQDIRGILRDLVFRSPTYCARRNLVQMPC